MFRRFFRSRCKFIMAIQTLIAISKIIAHTHTHSYTHSNIMMAINMFMPRQTSKNVTHYAARKMRSRHCPRFTSQYTTHDARRMLLNHHKLRPHTKTTKLRQKGQSRLLEARSSEGLRPNNEREALHAVLQPTQQKFPCRVPGSISCFYLQ